MTSDVPERRRRTDAIVTCCRSLAIVLLPFLAHAAAQWLEAWARAHTGHS
jgi:hypothetical protein